LNYIGVYALAALGLVLLTGIGGMVSFGQAAFVGIAAYATAWLTALQGYSPWLGLALALVLTCAAAAAIGAVTLRLGGHFLALSTVAWGLSIYFLFGNIDGLGHFTGISGIPPISIGPVCCRATCCSPGRGGRYGRCAAATGSSRAWASTRSAPG
jgi:branched-chain amino acid transport system permease protein